MFASEPPPTRPASSSDRPSSRPSRFAVASRARLRGSGSIGGRWIASLDLDRGAFENGSQASHCLLQLACSHCAGDAHVDDRARLRSDHVGPQAAVDGADVHGDPADGVVQCKQPLHLMRQLEDRADPVLEVGTRVRRPAVHGHDEAAEPLAGDLQLAVGAFSGLEHERSLGPACESPDVPGRVAAAGLLVRVHEHDGRHGRSEPELVERSKGEHDLHQAALHVGHARAEQLAVALADRHLGQRPDRPDGVHVADEQLVRLTTVALPGPRVQVIAGVPVPNRPDDEVDSLELRGENPERAPLAFGVERR